MEAARRQVQEVTVVMQENLNSVLERDQQLSDLDQRADSLAYGARSFADQSTRLKRKLWWKNFKFWAIVIGVVILMIIVGVFAMRQNDDSPPNSTTLPVTDTTTLPTTSANTTTASEETAQKTLEQGDASETELLDPNDVSPPSR